MIGEAISLAPLAVFKDATGDQVYVLAPNTDNVEDLPAHIEGGLEDVERLGTCTTETVTVVKLLQPCVLEPTTVYVFVVFGLAVTLAPTVGVNPAEGLHVYVLAPDAFNPALLPEQIVGY